MTDPQIDGVADAVAPSRTDAAHRAATVARMTAKSERMCREMVERLPVLDGALLFALYRCVLDEIATRTGRTVAELVREDPGRQ